MKKKKILTVGCPEWWFIFLSIPAGCILLTLLLKDASIDTKFTFMKFFSGFICLFFCIYKYWLYTDKDFTFNIYNEFPFQLCNWAAIIMFIGSLLESREIYSFCFAITLYCPLMAVLMPDKSFVNVPVYLLRNLGFYGYHNMIIIGSFLVTSLGLYVPKYSDVLIVLVILFVLASFAHILNTYLRKNHIFDEANYMFTYGDINPVLTAIKKVIPYNFIYEIPVMVIAGLINLLQTFIYLSIIK